jgi:hyperosmotically inducible periplasmic protein
MQKKIVIKALLILSILFSYSPLYADVVAHTIPALPTGTPRLPDADVNSALLQLIAADNMIATLNVSISTQNGIVSLQGQVDAESQAKEFIALAASTPGVQNVDVSRFTYPKNQPIPFNLVLTAKVTGALVREKVFPGATINSLPISIDTNYGIVYLRGTVDSTAQMIYAIKIAQAVPGVPRVISILQVRSSRTGTH